MKKILIAGFVLLSVSGVQAQQKQGVVVYERTSQIQIRFNDDHGGMEQQMPKTRTDKFELTFGNNQSLWKSAEDDNDNGTTDIGGGDGGGMQIRMVVAGNNDVLYNNFETGKRVEKRELFDKSFIIDDSIRSLKWKMTGETKTILNLPCMKATTTRTSTRTMMNMDNGKMEKKEIQDTSIIVAWFTSSIPVSAGPAEFQGQLPGLILEMDIKDGTQTFKATGISEKADLAVIKEPTGKKHYTPEEFKKEREKMMEEMNRNNQGGNRVIRIN
jgi:GLPGLI family protein